MRDRELGAPGDPQRPGQRDRARGGDVDCSAHRSHRRHPQGLVRIGLMEHLQVWIEAKLGRDHRQREISRQRCWQIGPDLGLVAQHAATQRRVTPGEVLEVGLQFTDVTLKAGAEREATCHLLAEERGPGRLTPIDRGGPADDDPFHGLGLLAGGQQLQGPDQVDVMQRPSGLAGFRVPEDAAVHDGVDAGRGQQAAQDRAADIDLDHLGPLEVSLRGPRVEAEDLLNSRIAGQATG